MRALPLQDHRAWSRSTGRVLLFCALRQSQNDSGADNEARFLQLLQTVVYYFCIAVDEKDSDRAASVGDVTLRPETRWISLKLVLRQN